MNRNPLELIEKPADYHCNARAPRGYCRNRAGYKTIHFGEGRCFLHGGNTPVNKTADENDFYIQSLYSKYLPTSLAEELKQIRTDPLFTTLFDEFALLRMLVLSLIKDLPVDLANIYGKPVCSVCKQELDHRHDTIFIEYPQDYKNLQKRLDKTIVAIREMANVYDKISKAQERQKRFVQITDLEAIIFKWGKILMNHFGDDPKISLVQEELMNSGFFRQPGEQDSELLIRFRKFQSKAKEKYIYRKKSKKDGKNVKVSEVYNDTFEEFFGNGGGIANVEEAEIIEVKKPKTRNAQDILKMLKKKNEKKTHR